MDLGIASPYKVKYKVHFASGQSKIVEAERFAYDNDFFVFSRPPVTTGTWQTVAVWPSHKIEYVEVEE